MIPLPHYSLLAEYINLDIVYRNSASNRSNRPYCALVTARRYAATLRACSSMVRAKR